MQLIFVYVADAQDREKVLNLCASSRLPRRQAHVLDESFCLYADRLRSAIPDPPRPYEGGSKADFYDEASVLLAASVLAASMVLPGLEKSRWPPLLVTDRSRLCRAVAQSYLRRPLIEVAPAKIKDSDVMTVIMAADFGTLCGATVTGPPLARCSSLLLASHKEPPAEAPQIQAELRPGVYIERPQRSDDEPGSHVYGLFGSRCWALLPSGRGAYSAISPDGVRAVQAHGMWTVLNGHVILVGAGKGSVQHLRLSHGEALALEVSYEEWPFIDVEELLRDFEPVRSLADCRPKAGQLLGLKLQEHRLRDERGAEGKMTKAGVLAAALDGRSPVGRLDDTIISAWPEQTAKDSREAQLKPSEKTVAHALISMASGVWEKEAGDLVPRLLGVERGMTLAKTRRAIESGSSGAAKEDFSLVAAWETNALQALCDSERSVSSGVPVPSCSLKPGRYLLEEGKRGGYGHRYLEIVLHADGTCEYIEEMEGSSLISRRETLWTTHDRRLLLYSRKPGETQFGFEFRENRGQGRHYEQRVSGVELPINEVLRRCRFIPWPQLQEPFPQHEPRQAAQRIFGLVDPSSPALQGLTLRAQRLPFHAFEFELRNRGLDVNEIISDFDFVDRDEDGEISVEELRAVMTYGFAAASPEVLDGLREGLVRRFGSLATAFEAFPKVTRLITQGGFEQFLREANAANAPSQEHLRTWTEKTSAQDRAACFATLNPNGGPGIDLVDFLSLSLHTAVLAVHRLQHLQAWILAFEKSPEVYRHVFHALGGCDADDVGLSRRAFAEGSQALGYPVTDANSVRSLFSLLDRSFLGHVSLKDFLKLRDFSGEALLLSVEALARFVEERGGIEECFKKLVEKEKALLGGGAALPKSASFDAFQKVFAGFQKENAKRDLKLVFLFLSEAAGRSSSARGFLAFPDFQLLKGFTAKAFTGSPARLRRILMEHFGSIDHAFSRMHTAWMQGALAKGLRQACLAGMARALASQAGQGTEGAQVPARRTVLGGMQQSVSLARLPAAPARTLRDASAGNLRRVLPEILR